MSSGINSYDSTFHGLALGMVLNDRYEIISFRGKGAFGGVYKAVDKGLDKPRTVAIKLIHPMVVSDAIAFKNIKREVGIARRLGHPNIVQIWDLVQWRDFTFIVMDYIEGANLLDLRAEQADNKPPFSTTLKYLKEISSGLDYLHNQTPPIIHRDLKPSNIIVDSATDRAVITDFGLAREIKDTMSRISGADTSGSPPYMAPEIWNNELPTIQSDIYALGVIVYELLSGDLPFRGPDYGYQHRNIVPRPIADLEDNVNSCILCALSKDLGKRFGTMSDFINVMAGQKMEAKKYIRVEKPTLELKQPLYLGRNSMIIKRTDSNIWEMDWSLRLDENQDVQRIWLPIPLERYNQDSVELVQIYPTPNGVFFEERYGNKFIYWSSPHDRNTLRMVRVLIRFRTYDLMTLKSIPITLDCDWDPEYAANIVEELGLEYSQDPAKNVVSKCDGYWGSKEALLSVERRTQETVAPFLEWNFGINNALSKGRGECGSISSTFVGLCRGKGIAARSIFAFHTLFSEFGTHAFSEFYIPHFGWLPRQEIPDSNVFPISKDCVVLTEGLHLKLPCDGPKISWWTCGAILEDKQGNTQLNQNYRFHLSNKDNEYKTVSIAAEDFKNKILSCDMNSSEARIITENFTSLGLAAINKIINFINHPDPRPRYWCAWFLSVVLNRNELINWLRSQDKSGIYHNTILNALPNLAGLGCIQQYEELCKQIAF